MSSSPPPSRGNGAALLSVPHRLFSRVFGRTGSSKGRSRAKVPDGPRSIDESLEAVAQALSSDDASSRMLALEVILGFSEERSAGLLAAVVHDPDPSVRRAAITAATRLGARRVVSSLILALDDPDEDVRGVARGAVAALTGKEVDPDDLEEPEQRHAIVESLLGWWKGERYRQLADQYGIAGAP